MNNQKNTTNQQQMKKSQSSVTSSVNAQQGQSTNAKQQASKAEYGTMTAKFDANNDYE